MDNDQINSAAWATLLASLLVLAIAGCAGDEDGPAAPELGGSDCAAVAPSAGAYAGPLYDTHAHADLSSAPAALDCLGDRHAIPTVVLFAGETGGSNAGERVEAFMAPYAPRFVPFVHTNPKGPADLAPAQLDAALAAAPQIRGVGELALYRDPWRDSHLDQAPWPELFRWVGEKDLWVMVHTRGEQVAELEAALAANPDVKFLFHSPWNSAETPDLLRKHLNLHFTLDLATLVSVPFEQGGMDVLMSPVSGGGAEFIRRYDAEHEAILEDTYARWAPVILAAPDRVMWGTDVHFDWHFEPEVYDRLIDFGRRFIAKLPADVREAYAYRNAERLLGPGPRF